MIFSLIRGLAKMVMSKIAGADSGNGVPTMLLAVLCGCVIGGSLAGMHCRSKIHAIEDAAAQQTALTVKAISSQHINTKRIADAAEKKYLAVEVRLNDQKKEIDRAIKPYLSGRNCLSADAVGVLNARVTSQPVAMPEARPAIAGADAGRFATDTDIAEWAADARHQYRRCAARLDALIDFEEQRP